MRFLRSRWTLGVLAFAILGTVGVMSMSDNASADDSSAVAHVTRGDFKVTVTVAGDLRAKSSVQIAPPQNTCMVNACQMKVASIIPEGSLVHKGDTVAELDRSPIVTSMNNTNLQLAKSQAVYEQAQLDTTLNLSKAREDLRLATTALEERRIGREQAAYEAPSIKRQAEIDFEKAERALAQGQVDYKTRENQAKAKMREVSTDLQRTNNQIQMMKDIASSFTIVAPAEGMLIYVRDYSGKKRGAGSMVYQGEQGIAELPDLTRMLSNTYVNEVDVRKVQVGQPVILTLDSDPSKHLSGKVIAVANVGEERPNTDAKVFEVKIEVAESDTTLRPGMTTSNLIEILQVKNALSIPLEAITTEGNVPFVFKKTGGTIVKQEVETGALNDMRVVITKGLDEGDVVLLLPPADRATLTVNRLTGSTPDAAPSKSVPMTERAAPVKAAPPSAKPPTPPANGRGRQ